MNLKSKSTFNHEYSRDLQTNLPSELKLQTKKDNTKREEISTEQEINMNNTRSHLQRFLAGSDAAPQMTVEFRNMTARVPANIKSKEMKTILNNVSGIIRPGEFIALMGPSGSGKSTLLNILGSRFDAENGECSGEILINGQPRNKKFKKHFGYVLQQDFILPNLTVRETLEITAKLRLPSTMSMPEKMERVEDIIQVMGLQTCANTMIQKVSGGESKRLSIANELLINPSVLFLDEPTSGLDSTSAFSILNSLKELCMQGRTIFCAIHQPSNQMFSKFDKLLLLASGEVIYFGPIHSCIKYFASIGFECPTHFAPADYILEVITDNFAFGNECMKDKQEIKAKLIQAWKTHSIVAGTDTNVEITDNKTNIEEKDVLILSEVHSLDSHLHTSSTVNNSSRWNTTWFEQFSILFVRAFKHRRGHVWSKPSAIQLITIGLMGLIWFNIPTTEENLQDWIGANNFIVIVLGFSMMHKGVAHFPLERSVVKKERNSGSYRLSAYYLSKICAELPVDLLLPIVCSTMFYLIVGFSYDFSIYLWYMVSTCLGIITADAFGIFLGCTFKDITHAFTILVTIGVLNIAFMGYLVKDRAIPVWIAWLKYFSHFRYSFLTTLWTILSVTKFECAQHSVFDECDENHAEYDGYIHMDAIFKVQQVTEEYWMTIVILIALMMLWYLLAFLFISRNTRTKNWNI